MARNAIESELRTSKMADGSQFVKNFQKKIKLCINLKWPEIRSKVNFGHRKWPTAAIMSKISQKNKVAYRSEMARNAIESEFRTSKMGSGGHFAKQIPKIKVAYRSEMARNVIRREFWTSKMAAGGHFAKKSLKQSFVLIWNGQKCHRKCVSDIQYGRRHHPICVFIDIHSL